MSPSLSIEPWAAALWEDERRVGGGRPARGIILVRQRSLNHLCSSSAAQACKRCVGVVGCYRWRADSSPAKCQTKQLLAWRRNGWAAERYNVGGEKTVHRRVFSNLTWRLINKARTVSAGVRWHFVPTFLRGVVPLCCLFTYRVYLFSHSRTVWRVRARWRVPRRLHCRNLSRACARAADGRGCTARWRRVGEGGTAGEHRCFRRMLCAPCARSFAASHGWDGMVTAAQRACHAPAARTSCRLPLPLLPPAAVPPCRHALLRAVLRTAPPRTPHLALLQHHRNSAFCLPRTLRRTAFFTITAPQHARAACNAAYALCALRARTAHSTTTCLRAAHRRPHTGSASSRSAASAYSAMR